MERRLFFVTHPSMEIVTYGKNWTSYKNFRVFKTRKSLNNYLRFLRFYKINYGYFSRGYRGRDKNE